MPDGIPHQFSSSGPGQFWKAEAGNFWRAPKTPGPLAATTAPPDSARRPWRSASVTAPGIELLNSCVFRCHRFETETYDQDPQGFPQLLCKTYGPHPLREDPRPRVGVAGRVEPGDRHHRRRAAASLRPSQSSGRESRRPARAAGACVRMTARDRRRSARTRRSRRAVCC